MSTGTRPAQWIVSAIAALVFTAAAGAANSPPFAGAWSIAAKGKAQSSGELLFRVTPRDGADPVEVTVNVLSGTTGLAVAREIRAALDTGLRRDRFNVELGAGAQVLVTDESGAPNFSLELIQADVENLQVTVLGAPPSRSPAGVQSSDARAAPPVAAPSPGNAGQPSIPPPANSSSPPAGAPTPGNVQPPPAPGGTPPAPGAPAASNPASAPAQGSGSATAPPGN